ncbi:MAG: hypothetical protein K6B46_03030 [Opitutales bacterium]|nr:hypothetical protein [Opitutales bacterium]
MDRKKSRRILNDNFGYNSRSELTSATLGNDNVGNRSTATAAGTANGAMRD